MLIRIAWRNIWRNRNRSLILAAAVAIGIWAGLFLVSFYNGLVEQRIETAISRELSHLQVHTPRFITEHDVRDVIPHGPALFDSLRALPEVASATGRVVVQGMIASARGARGITVTGVFPDFEAAITDLPGKVVEGGYFTPDKKNEIIISRLTSERLRLGLNKKAIVTFEDATGSMSSGAFRIVGIYQTSNRPYDERYAFVDAGDIDSLAGIDGQLSEIAIRLHRDEAMPVLQAGLTAAYPAVTVRNWQEISPELGLTVSVVDDMILIFMGIILLALAFGLVNTMMMSVLERTREIGMLLAVGMNKFRVFAMILLETGLLIMTGAPVGLALGLVTVAILHRTGIHLDRYAEAYSSFGYAPDIYPTLYADQLGMIVVMILATSVLAALFPARRALRLSPAVALKS